MRLSTLKEIERLLEANVKETEEMHKKSVVKVIALENEQLAKETAEFDEINYKFWEEVKKQRWKEHSEAIDALEDFLAHDWN